MSDSHQTTKNSASPIKKSTPATPQLDQPDVEMEVSEEQEMMGMGGVMQRAQATPQSLKPPEVMQLQRLVGNRAVNRLLGGGVLRRKDAAMLQPRAEAEAYRAPKPTPIQPARYKESSPHVPAYAKYRNLPIQAKLTVGPVGDEYEKEADRVASQVMSMPSQPVTEQRGAAAQDDLQMKPLVQRLFGDDNDAVDNEDELQAKRLVQRVEDEELLQGKPLVQRVEDEELLQGKPLVQRVEDEELLQGKPLVQRVEEEELLQGKPLVQRVEEEELLQGKPLVQRVAGDEDEQESMQLKRLPVVIQRFGSDGQDTVQLKRLPSIMRFGSDGEEQAQLKPLPIQRFGSDGEEQMQMKPLSVQPRGFKGVQRAIEGGKGGVGVGSVLIQMGGTLTSLGNMMGGGEMPKVGWQEGVVPHGDTGDKTRGVMGSQLGSRWKEGAAPRDEMGGKMRGLMGGQRMGSVLRKPLVQREVAVRGRKPKSVQRFAPLLMALLPMIMPMIMPMIQPMIQPMLSGLMGGMGGGGGGMGEMMGGLGGMAGEMMGSMGQKGAVQAKPLVQREVAIEARKPKSVQRFLPMLMGMMPMLSGMMGGGGGAGGMMGGLTSMMGGMMGGGGAGGGMGGMMGGLTGMMGGGAGGMGGMMSGLMGMMGGGGMGSMMRKPLVQRRSLKSVQREAALPGPDTMSNVQGGLKGSTVTNSEGTNPAGVMQRFQGVMSNMNSMLGGLGGMLGGGANAQMGSGGSIGGLLQMKRIKQPQPKSIQRTGDPITSALGAITGAMSGGGGADKNMSGMLQRFDGMIGGLGGMLTGLGGLMGGMTGGLQAKPSVQREFDGSFQTTSNFETRLHGANMGGNPLPDVVRRELEPKFGADFSQVRIHADSQAGQLNREVQARAFTHGAHIHFGAGEYNPGTSAGKGLLAHELTHVVQQTGAGRVSPKRLVRLQRKVHSSPLNQGVAAGGRALMQREVEVRGRKPKAVQRFAPLLLALLPMLMPMVMPMIQPMISQMMGG